MEELKEQLTTQQSLLTIVKGSSTTDASFAVAQIIGKHKKPLVMANASRKQLWPLTSVCSDLSCKGEVIN